MLNDLTWDALLHAWPWFVAAAGVCVVAVGLFIALKPESKRQLETTTDAADKTEWTLTRRIDLADPELGGSFVLEVEESRISISPTGVEHREIRWRRATLPEAKMVLESYHAQQDLVMSGTFDSAVTQREINEQAETLETELKDTGAKQEMPDVTLVPMSSANNL
jgi:hypothetical protein